MPTFQYKALQADGTIAEGEVEAGGRQEAFRQMEGRGLRPIRLAERNGGNGAAKSPAKPVAKTPAKPVAQAKAPTRESNAEKGNGSPLSFKLSLGGAGKVSARM